MPRTLNTRGKVASATVAGRRFFLALLFLLSAASLRPSSQVLASSAGNNEAGEKPAQSATLTSASATSPDIPFAAYDSEAERTLLDLANHARKQAGKPMLALDPGLCAAARAHARAMVQLASFPTNLMVSPPYPSAWRLRHVPNWTRRGRMWR